MLNYNINGKKISYWDGSVLKELVQNCGVRKMQLCKMINIAPQQMNDYMNNVNAPSLKTVIILADYFNVPLDFLTGRCSENKIDDIIKNYRERFLEMKRLSYEEYLYKRVCAVDLKEDKYIVPYPYNLLYDMSDDFQNMIVGEKNLKSLEYILDHTLNEKEVELVHHYYRDNLSVKEMMKIYGISDSGIHCRLQSILRRLRFPLNINLIMAGFASFDEFKKYNEEILENVKEDIVDTAKTALCIDTMSEKIDDLNLSSRAANALKRNNIFTVGELLVNLEKIRQINGIGDIIVREILTSLNACVDLGCYIKDPVLCEHYQKMLSEYLQM